MKQNQEICDFWGKNQNGPKSNLEAKNMSSLCPNYTYNNWKVLEK